MEYVLHFFKNAYGSRLPQNLIILTGSNYHTPAFHHVNCSMFLLGIPCSYYLGCLVLFMNTFLLSLTSIIGIQPLVSKPNSKCLSLKKIVFKLVLISDVGIEIAPGFSIVGEENVNLRDLLGVIYRANFHPWLATK